MKYLEIVVMSIIKKKNLAQEVRQKSLAQEVRQKSDVSDRRGLKVGLSPSIPTLFAIRSLGHYATCMGSRYPKN